MGTLAELSRRLDCGSAIRLVQSGLAGLRLYITQSCLEQVIAHVSADPEEVGGLLLGRAYEFGDGGNPLIVLEEALESLEYRNSAVSLRMETEIWGRTEAAFREARLLVGWYHSHPGLDALFSSTDRATQRHFFNNAYSVGWVIDPCRGEQALYLGPARLAMRNPSW